VCVCVCVCESECVALSLVGATSYLTPPNSQVCGKEGGREGRRMCVCVFVCVRASELLSHSLVLVMWRYYPLVISSRLTRRGVYVRERVRESANACVCLSVFG